MGDNNKLTFEKKLKSLDEKHKIRINKINEKKLSREIPKKLLIGAVIGCCLALTAGLTLKHEGLGLPFVKDNTYPIYQFEERIYTDKGTTTQTIESELYNNDINQDYYTVVRYIIQNPKDYKEYKDYLYVIKGEKYKVHDLKENKIKEIVNNPLMSLNFLGVKPEVSYIVTNELFMAPSNYAVVETPFKKLKQVGVSPYKPEREIADIIASSTLILLSLGASAAYCRSYARNFDEYIKDELDTEDKRYTKKRNKLLSKNK